MKLLDDPAIKTAVIAALVFVVALGLISWYVIVNYPESTKL